MTVQSSRVTNNQPSVPPSGHDEHRTKVSRLPKRPEPDPNRVQVIPTLSSFFILSFHLFESTGFTLGHLGLGVGDESPDEGGHGEEDGGHEARVVVSELLDEGGGGEGSGGSGDFVEDVHNGVHSSELCVVGEDDVSLRGIEWERR